METQLSEHNDSRTRRHKIFKQMHRLKIFDEFECLDLKVRDDVFWKSRGIFAFAGRPWSSAGTWNVPSSFSFS